MNKSQRRRQPKGQPVGGQFAPELHPEPELDLTDSGLDTFTEFVDSRKAALKTLGYVQPTAAPVVINPNSTAHRREWWETNFAAAEYGNSSGSYAQMPDDWTPSKSLGNSIDGFRRTHRMSYVGAGVTLRMPSVSSIRSFSNASVDGKRPGETFDVPVSAQFPGGAISGWVRVVRGADGTWGTKGLGFTREQSAYVAESVQCVLEARHPSRALSEVGDLLERRRQRAAALGAVPQQVRSGWIKDVGYDQATSTMVMSTNVNSGARHYGFRVPFKAFQRLIQSKRPGAVFNSTIRGHSKRVTVSECEKCGRFTADGVSHRCPPKPSPRHEMIQRVNRVRQHLTGE
ncbi:MAG: hypothetical protein ACYDEP_02710 [Acidimicrobiales bacterium]